MSVIQGLRLKGFEGYLDSGSVLFTPGLNLITGRNSTGKTTLLEGILYGLYGKIPDVDDRVLVSKRGGENFEVHLKFMNPITKKTVEIHRTGGLYTKKGTEYFRTSEQRVLLEDREISLNTQEEIRTFVYEQLGFGIKRFMNLVYVRQGQLNRILEPSREDMDLVLGITVIRELKEQLNQTKKELEKYEEQDVATQLRQLEEETIPNLKSRLKQLRSDISFLKKEERSLRELIEKAESLELQYLLRLIGERDTVEGLLNNVKIQARTFLERHEVKHLDALGREIKKKKKHLEKLKKDAEAKRKATDELKTKIDSYSAIAQRLEEEAERHQRLLEEGKENCPVCGQKVTAQTIQSLIQEKRSEAKKYEVDVEKLSKPFKKADGEANDLSNKSHQLESQIDQMTGDEGNLQKLMKEAEGHQQILEDNIARIDKELEKLQLPLKGEDPDLRAKVAEKLPLDPETLKEKKMRHKMLVEKTQEYDEEKKKNEKLLDSSRNLLDTLKNRRKRAEITGQIASRLELVTENVRKRKLKRLENQALRIYNQLTDQRLYQAISIDEDTYKVNVHPTGAKGSIPATRTGGGHQTLLSLALRLAILREGGYTHLLILDEPTYGVDSENLPQLISYITEAAKQVSQVLLVTHHGIGEEDATNIINVELNAKGFSQITT